MRTLTFDLDSLPLVIENGFEACELGGGAYADISYNPHGEWGVESIYFDGSKRIKHGLADIIAAAQEGKFLQTFERKGVNLDRGTPLYSIIHDRLESEWHGRVQEEVNEQINEDRIAAADDYADMKRDRMMEDR